MTSGSPRRGWTSMKPPPPMFPASGNVTASAKAVATAASTALPPSRKTSRPTSDAGGETDTTVPRFDTELKRSDETADRAEPAPDEPPPAQPATNPKTRNNSHLDAKRRAAARQAGQGRGTSVSRVRCSNLVVPSARPGR